MDRQGKSFSNNKKMSEQNNNDTGVLAKSLEKAAQTLRAEAGDDQAVRDLNDKNYQEAMVVLEQKGDVNTAAARVNIEEARALLAMELSQNIKAKNWDKVAKLSDILAKIL